MRVLEVTNSDLRYRDLVLVLQNRGRFAEDAV